MTEGIDETIAETVQDLGIGGVSVHGHGHVRAAEIGVGDQMVEEGDAGTTSRE
jgi:hypothetical protein